MAKLKDKILENEKEIFQKLFDLNKKIYKLYQRLINEPENYKKIVDYITICREVEENLYNELDYERLNIYLRYIDVKFLKEITDYDITLADFYELAIKKRIYTRLKYKDEDSLLQLLEDNKDYYQDDVYQKILFAKMLDEDFKGLYVYFINELLKDKRSNRFKKKLEKAKYLMCFINPILEEDLIINQCKTFVNCFSIASVTDISDEDTTKLVNIYIVHYLKKYFKLLLKIKNEEYQDKDTYFKALLYEALIKSCYEMNGNLVIREDESIKDIVGNERSKETIRRIIENKDSYDYYKLKPERYDHESSK